MSDSAATPDPLHGTTGPVRITYRDTDRMGHVYHSNYFVWFEMGRTELLRAQGAGSYKDLEDREGVFLPVVSCWAEFRQAVDYDDLIQVVTTVTEMTRATITFTYEIRSADAQVLHATGGTRHAFVDAEGKVARNAWRVMPGIYEARKAKSK